MTILLLVQSTLNAQTTPKTNDCDSVIKACDKALVEKNKALDLADLALKKTTSELGRVKTENQELRDENSSIWKNPFFMFLFGSTAATAGYLILRH